MAMKYFSTFSGIGGFELGIQLAHDNRPNLRNGSTDIPNDLPDLTESSNGATCVGFSEIDKYATAIYQSHFPEHKNYGDITQIDETTLPDFDLLVGGFPCQSFSIAGKRRGFEDTRGTMFFELARILRAKQPRLFVFENVKGLLSHDNGQTFSTIISTITELGYDCQWQVLNSKNHGVPQNRERVFIVGHLRGTRRPEVFPFRKIYKNSSQFSTKTGWTKSETAISTTLATKQFRTEQTYIQQLNQPTHSNDRVYGTEGISPTLNTMQGGNRQPFVQVPEATKQGYAVATVGQSINLAVPNSKTRRGRVSDVAQTLDTGMQQHTLTSNARIRRLTPIECCRLQGFPDNWVDGISDTQKYKCLGNAVTVNVITDIMQTLLEKTRAT